MPTELVDPIATLLILAFVIGRGIVLLKNWRWLNIVTVKDKPSKQQTKPQQTLTHAPHNTVVDVVIPKNQ